MEFYLKSLKEPFLILSVSIPNGMEFYGAGRFTWAFATGSFNSQRDGILRKYQFCVRPDL